MCYVIKPRTGQPALSLASSPIKTELTSLIKKISQKCSLRGGISSQERYQSCRGTMRVPGMLVLRLVLPDTVALRMRNRFMNTRCPKQRTAWFSGRQLRDFRLTTLLTCRA